LRAVRSVLSDEKKLSIAALSQTLQDRLKVSSSFSEAGPFARLMPNASIQNIKQVLLRGLV
jgi:hypothetical protein